MLLDLLGAADPLIANHFDNTARWFDRLIAGGLYTILKKKEKKKVLSLL